MNLPDLCPECNGTGDKRVYKNTLTARVGEPFFTEKIQCDTCEGGGLVFKEVHYKPYKPFKEEKK